MIVCVMSYTNIDIYKDILYKVHVAINRAKVEYFCETMKLSGKKFSCETSFRELCLNISLHSRQKCNCNLH